MSNRAIILCNILIVNFGLLAINKINPQNKTIFSYFSCNSKCRGRRKRALDIGKIGISPIGPKHTLPTKNFTEFRTLSRLRRQKAFLVKKFKSHTWYWWWQNNRKVFFIYFPVHFYKCYGYYPPIYYDFYELYKSYPTKSYVLTHYEG